jgi:hypothetical protein
MLLALSLSLAADDFEAHRFYYGDIHAHTGASGDAGSSDMGTCLEYGTGAPANCGAVADVGATARANGLDFLATVDHVTSATATTTTEQWEQVFQQVNDLDDPDGGFVTLPGAEIFLELEDGSDLGHRSLLFFADRPTLAGVTQLDTQPSGSISNVVVDCTAVSTFMEGLTSRFGNAFLLPHHPGVRKPMATDWNCYDERYEPIVEVYSEHGSSMDSTSTFDIPWSGYFEAGTARNAIHPSKFGLRPGFGAGTDNHDTHPGQVCDTDTVQTNHPYGGGLTVVVLPEADRFDRSAIHAAMLERRVYATTGPHVPLVVEVRLADGTVLGEMGQELVVANGTDLVIEARLPADAGPAVVDVTAVGPAASWTMVRVGEGTWSVTVPGAEMPENIYVDVTLDAGVIWSTGCPDGGTDSFDHLWSSPTWFDPEGGDGDGDGFSPEAGDCDDTNPNVYPGARELCTRAEADQDCDGVPAAEDPDCLGDTGDTGDTGANLPVKDTDLPSPTADDTGVPGPTHRCACAGPGPEGLGLALGVAALLAASRRRKS